MTTGPISQIVLHEALNASKEPIFILNPANECVFANTAFFALLGYDPSSRTIKTMDFWPAPGGTEFKGVKGERYSVKFKRTELPEGYILFQIISSVSHADPVNTFHTQRLETLGILAGGVAHDFNNILMGVLGHTTYLKNILPKQGPHMESLTAIEEGTRRGSAITQQILNFSKLDSQASALPVDMGDLVSRTCTLVRRTVSAPHVFDYKDVQPKLTVLALEAHIAQVLINLIVNAVDALNTKGSITVSLQAVSDEQELAEVFKNYERSATRYARLSVSDTGHGIPKDLLPKIFEPYFSTKKEKGTGLGLATVDSIVRALGGVIDVKSAVGSGTVISVYLPLVEQSSEAAKDQKTTRKVIGGTERILVVDDEYPVRNVLVISLQHLGYKVDAASSGQEAVEIFNDKQGEFDLVITDMLMPQMSGDELFTELRKKSADLRILIMSGFASEEAINNLLTQGASGFLAKPFTIDELAKRVRECLK